MIKILNKTILITKHEYDNFDVFIEKFKSSDLEKIDQKYFLNSDFDKSKIQINFNPLLLDFTMDQDIKKIMSIVLSALEETFKLVKNYFIKEDLEDFRYVDNNDSFDKIIQNILCYSEIHDIFDLFSNIFIQMLISHKLRNGNKRFSFLFLINLLKSFGFYFKLDFDLKNKNYYEKIKKNEMFCFVARLSNRSYYDFKEMLIYAEFNDNNSKNQEYYWCYNLNFQ
ncbi:type II toxin-antitoxin system death-on-curing family toxin [Mycoplasma leonicaptivi]|uniref:type II toxin-antitoxin system death-on-curing family toxin n=1 Tax=Mycoplasma leonicaptivi TaxID=36742 RepID=UPI00047F61AD|nr:type II toxin-antitoxin system death-on-curing family toxin [Mycoplasma leonicaptivi]